MNPGHVHFLDAIPKTGFHLNECTNSAGRTEVYAFLEGDYRPMEKFKSFELLNKTIWSSVTEGESTSDPTTHAPTSRRLGRIGAFG